MMTFIERERILFLFRSLILKFCIRYIHSATAQKRSKQLLLLLRLYEDPYANSNKSPTHDGKKPIGVAGRCFLGIIRHSHVALFLKSAFENGDTSHSLSLPIRYWNSLPKKKNKKRKARIVLTHSNFLSCLSFGFNGLFFRCWLFGKEIHDVAVSRK